MAATAAVKQNTTAQGYSYYFSIPRELCDVPGMTISATMLGGLLSSFSGKEDENGNVKTFEGKREKLKGFVGGSLSTLSRSMTKLKSKGYVERNGMSSHTFKQDKLVSDKTWNLPLDITTRIFEIKDEDGNIIARRTLTPAEKLTYSYFYTKLASCTHKSTIEAAYKVIAAELGLDPTTVSAAVNTLSRSGLLYCPKDWIGVNGHKKGRIGLVKKWSWFKQEKQYRERKEKPSENKAPKAQPATVSRDNYYKELQEAAQQKASDAIDAALSYEQYRKLDAERKDVSALLRRALVSGNTDYGQELSEKVKKLDLKCRTALKSLGFEPDSLTPEYYARCKECGDTGWKKDGSACGCRKERRQGSPLGKSKGTTKGIE